MSCSVITIVRYVGFCFNDTATTEIYTYLHTLSLHDALPISSSVGAPQKFEASPWRTMVNGGFASEKWDRLLRSKPRSEEHTSELQSLMRTSYAVFCLKKNRITSAPQILQLAR